MLRVFTTNEKYDVGYFPVSCPDLGHIHFGLRSLLHKDPPSFKDEYTPHVTLGYFNKGCIEAGSINPNFTSMSCLVKEVSFTFKDETPIFLPLEY